MRNTELIAKIYEMVQLPIQRGSYTTTDIKEFIEKERPEIARNNLWKNKDNFWSGGHLEKK